MLNMNQIVGEYDILFITLDTLRYDVAVKLYQEGKTPYLQQILPPSGWEKRQTSGNFTYTAHHGFFAGFLPTPSTSGIHPRLFALNFQGSVSTTENTCILEGSDIVQGLAKKGYHTVCIGGVGFFNQLTPLGCVFPNLFTESYWDESLGVTDKNSTENQVNLALKILNQTSLNQPLFLFINISAFHQPNYFYLNPLDEIKEDSIYSHGAALEYVDRELQPLWLSIKKRKPTFVIISSDHGTAYGEDNYYGHRCGHSVVWTVPYAEFILS